MITVFFTNSKAASLVRFHHLIQTEIALPEPARLRTYMHWLYTPTFMNNPTYSWQWVAKKLTHSFARHSAYKFYNEDSLTHARKLFLAEGKKLWTIFCRITSSWACFIGFLSSICRHSFNVEDQEALNALTSYLVNKLWELLLGN